MTPQTIIEFLVVLLIGIIGWLARDNMQKLHILDKELENKITEQETRQILSDKLEPLKEGLNDVREKLDRLYNMLLK